MKPSGALIVPVETEVMNPWFHYTITPAHESTYKYIICIYLLCSSHYPSKIEQKLLDFEVAYCSLFDVLS